MPELAGVVVPIVDAAANPRGSRPERRSMGVDGKHKAKSSRAESVVEFRAARGELTV